MTFLTFEELQRLGKVIMAMVVLLWLVDLIRDVIKAKRG